MIEAPPASVVGGMVWVMMKGSVGEWYWTDEVPPS